MATEDQVIPDNATAKEHINWFKLHCEPAFMAIDKRFDKIEEKLEKWGNRWLSVAGAIIVLAVGVIVQLVILLLTR